MPKSKTRKNHKSKVAARNAGIKNQSAKAQKFQREFIENLIKQEQEKGMFNNNTTLDPIANGPIIEGPML
jgi:hypothetical protein